MMFTIFTPMFNDETYILETLMSVDKQSFEDWEMIIIDDGSTDSSYEVVREWITQCGKEHKFKLFRQKNQDQLSAIYNHLKYAEGDVITVLHSDDVFSAIDTLEKVSVFFMENPGLDAANGNLDIMNAKGQLTETVKVKKYINTEYQLVEQLIYFGRHLYNDFFYVRRNSIDIVAKSYLTWNIPFWIKQDAKMVTSMNMGNFPFSVIKYRVHGDNYINNNIGVFNVVNGELRTAQTIMRNYYIPFYTIQNKLYRVLRKIGVNYPIFYKNEKAKNTKKVLLQILKTRYNQAESNPPYISALFLFMKKNNDRVIKVTENLSGEVLFGRDIRMFANMNFNKTLSSFYSFLLTEMSKGFSTVECTVSNLEDVKTILEFLNIINCVNIVVDENYVEN